MPMGTLSSSLSSPPSASSRPIPCPVTWPTAWPTAWHCAQTLLDDLAQTLHNGDLLRLTRLLTPDFHFEDFCGGPDCWSGLIRQARNPAQDFAVCLEVFDVQTTPEALHVRALCLLDGAAGPECMTLELLLVRVRHTLRVHSVRIQERTTPKTLLPTGAQPA